MASPPLAPVHIPSRASRASAAGTLPTDRNFQLLTRVMLFLVGGYLLFDRAFAWIHIPGTPVFLGEISLGFGLFVILQTPHLGRVLRLSRPIQLLAGFMLWGFAIAFQGFEEWGIDAIRDSALWYYGLFAIITAVMLLYNPKLWDELVDKFTGFIPYFLLVMILRLAFTQASIGPRIPDSTTRLVSHKSANIAVNIAIALAFLIIVVGPASSKKLQQRNTLWTLLGLLLIVGAGTQSRGGFIAAIFILGVVFLLARHARGAMVGILVVSVLVGIMAAALDVKFQLDRRELSISQVIENVQSISEEATTGSRFDNTTQWRLNLWGDVLEDVLREERVFAGLGFGENLAQRYEVIPKSSVPLRNPHNSHLSVIARMGMVGALFWVAMFGTWFFQLAKSRRLYIELGEERHANLSTWVMLAVSGILLNAFFDPTIEGPQVGVWIWTLFGMGAVLGLGARASRSHHRRGTGLSDYDWLLLREEPVISAAHPSVLGAEMQEVVEGFDELIGRTEDDEEQ